MNIVYTFLEENKLAENDEECLYRISIRNHRRGLEVDGNANLRKVSCALSEFSKLEI